MQENKHTDIELLAELKSNLANSAVPFEEGSTVNFLFLKSSTHMESLLIFKILVLF